MGLGIVHLVEVESEPGKWTCPPGLPSHPAPKALSSRGSHPCYSSLEPAASDEPAAPTKQGPNCRGNDITRRDATSITVLLRSGNCAKK